MHHILNFYAKNKFLTLAAELAHFPLEIPAHFFTVGHTLFEIQDSHNYYVKYDFKIKLRAVLKML